MVEANKRRNGEHNSAECHLPKQEKAFAPSLPPSGASPRPAMPQGLKTGAANSGSQQALRLGPNALGLSWSFNA